MGTMEQMQLSKDFNVSMCYVQITIQVLCKSVQLLTRMLIIIEVYFQQYMRFKDRFDLLDLPDSLDILML